jgi:hypothetical protein
VLPSLVRDVPVGDVNRAGIVGAHVAEFAQLLHTHHVTEDEHLWGLLEERSPACQLHVERMRWQHHTVAGTLERLDAQLPGWEHTGQASTRAVIAGLLDEVNESLGVHLGDEESRILPVASVTLSQREWDAFGDLGRKSIPKKRLLVQLGYVLDTVPPEHRASWMIGNLPRPVRGLYRMLGRRQFERDYLRVYGVEPA